MDNLYIYNAAREVPPEAQKQFNNGRFSGTDINPMWRIKKLTELFGPCGIGWYYEVLSERSERLTDDTLIAVVDLNLYIKHDGEWSKPIFGTGGNQLVNKTNKGVSTSDEGYKMALTDALSVACKALGIGANVYFQKDTTKYTAKPPAPAEKPQTAVVHRGKRDVIYAAPVTQDPPAELPPLPFDDSLPRPKAMATAEQIEFIINNSDDQTCENAMMAFGPDLERMTRKQAEKLIARIKEANPNAQTV